MENKLNKLDKYKCSSYFLTVPYALFDKPLIDGEFEAWVHGPVSRELWVKFTDYGFFNIPKNACENYRENFSSEDNELLERVWDTYGEFSGFQLENLTHQELPWIKARENCSPQEPSNNIISDKDMKSYYTSIYIGDGVGEEF